MKRPQYFAAKPIADEYIPIENEIVLWRSVLDQAMQDIAYTGRDKEYIKFRNTVLFIGVCDQRLNQSIKF